MDKFISPEPLPTDYEHELLTILIEECNEVAQRACKVKRFGFAEIQPGQQYTNAQRLAEEIGQVQYMINALATLGLIPLDSIEKGKMDKRVKLRKYLQTSPEDV